VSITLYVVAAVLLVMILRDQRKALATLQFAASAQAVSSGGTTPLAGTAVALADEAQPELGTPQSPAQRSAGAESAGAEKEEDAGVDGEQAAAGESPAPTPATPGAAPGVAIAAAVERARISSLSGVVALIWLVSLVLMVWK
jgi:hypothetical protein